MRVRLAAIAAVSLITAGCGTGTFHTASAAGSAAAAVTGSGGATATRPAPSSAPAAATASASAPAPATGAATAAPRGACAGTSVQLAEPGALTGLEFVSAARGWAVGLDTILATTDGGAHWRTQLSGKLALTSVDFVNGQDGWAVGAASVLATTDGGAHWTPLPDPCPLIRSVHFISPTAGFAVAGGSDPGGSPSAVPEQGGVVLATGDGGRSWHAMSTPKDAQSVCFSDPRHGWLGAAGRLYGTTDGGLHWTGPLTPEAAGTQAGYEAEMTVQCAGGSAWALRTGPGVGMSQEAHVGYHAGQPAVTALFAEQYWRSPGDPSAASPGSDPGPFSAISPAAAAFVDYCAACGPGTAPWDLASNAGATLTREGNVGAVSDPQAASFLSAAAGWVAGADTVFPAAANGTPKTQERIVGTTDGGRTWHVEWAGPWTS